jgi:hypothetical protein
MKRAALLLFLCASVGFAQQPAEPAPAQAAAVRGERVPAPSYSDLYCAGFISNQAIAHGNYIIAGAESPAQTEFHQNDYVFLEGTSFAEGARFSVLRPLRDPNRSAAFHGQAAAISAVGQPYAELGRVRVTAVRGKGTVAQVEFSCAPMTAGDLLVPFQEKVPVTYRTGVAFERFPAAQSSVSGRIVMAKEFDYVVGTGQKVYLNVGADKGIKVGDYFHALRNYDPKKMGYVDALSYKVQQTEDTQKYSAGIPKSRYAELPKEAIAQMIVLDVTPTSSTAMITFALEDVSVGDAVELEGGGQR